MLPSATARILATLRDDDLVLDVGGWAAPFARADWVLDLMPYETRGGLGPGRYGPGPERFGADTWAQRDICDREPWPFADDQFAFALCVTTLEDVRDPVWVCSELSRVARAGYVEVPTIEHELTFGLGGGPFLGHDHHRWLVEQEGAGLVFTHKPHSIHHDRRLRVPPRWAATLALEDQLLGVFWEGALPARERVCVGGFPLDAWAARIEARFAPSRSERLARAAAERTRHAGALARRPVRRAAERVLARATSGR